MRGRSSGTRSRRGARHRRRGRYTASRSGCSTSSRPHAGAPAARPSGRRRRRRRRAERSDLRVVAVQNEHRRLRERHDRRPPPLGDQLKLAVAVELVAEKIAEADGTRPHAPQHLRQGTLVDLEQSRARRPRLRAGWTRRRRRGSRPSGCARAGTAAGESPRPSRSSSSCRSSPRRQPCRQAVASPTGRSRLGRASREASPARSCRRRAPSRRDRPATAFAAAISTVVSMSRGYVRSEVPRSSESPQP